MASINLSGILKDPTGEVAVGDQIRFTHRTTTGDTIKFARSVLIIPPGGDYDIDLEFGNILVEYLDIKDVNYKNLGIVTVNGDSTAVTLPELLLAIVPPTDEQLLEFQNILADTTTQADNAATSAAAALVSESAAAASADASAVNGNIFVDTTAGLAGTSIGDFFSVPSALDIEHLILFKHETGPIATQIKIYPSSSAVGPLIIKNRSDFVEPAFRRMVLINEDEDNSNKSTLNVWDSKTLRFSNFVDFHPSQVFQSSDEGVYVDAFEFDTLFQDDLAVTPVTTSGQSVGQIKDLSGNGNNLIQATGASKPTYIEDGTDRFLRFDGVASTMTALGVDFSGATKGTIIASYRQNRVSGLGAIMSHGVGFTNGINLMENNGTAGAVSIIVGEGVNNLLNFTKYNAFSPVKRVTTIKLDPDQATNTNKLVPRVDGFEVDDSQGSAAGTVTSAIFRNLDVHIGAVGGVSAFTTVDLDSLLYINRELTQIEIDAVEGFLLDRQVNIGNNILTVFDDSAKTFDAVDFKLPSSLSSVSFSTDATSVDITGNVSVNLFTFNPEMSKIGIFINGVFDSTISPGANDAFAVTAPLPAGAKTVTLVNSPQQGANQSLVAATVIETLTFNRVSTPVDITPVDTMVIYGDSISVGVGATPLQEKAWSVQVRDARTGNTLTEAYGGRSLFKDAETANDRARIVGKIVSENPSILYIAIGTNDFGLNSWTAANFGIAYAAMLDDLSSQLPNLLIFCQTPTVRTTETANGLGSTLDDYRTEISNAVAARPLFTTLVDGTTILVLGDLIDGLHPSTAGHTKYADFVKLIDGII